MSKPDTKQALICSEEHTLIIVEPTDRQVGVERSKSGPRCCTSTRSELSAKKAELKTNKPNACCSENKN